MRMPIAKNPNLDKEESFADWMFNKKVDMRLLVLAILDGQTNSELVPKSHILAVAKEFEVELEEKELDNEWMR